MKNSILVAILTVVYLVLSIVDKQKDYNFIVGMSLLASYYILKELESIHNTLKNNK